MSIKYMLAAWESSVKSKGELLVLMALADVADDKGHCWPSQEYLGNRCRMTTRSVRTQLDKLSEGGFVRIETTRDEKGKLKSRYWLQLEHRKNFPSDEKPAENISPTIGNDFPDHGKLFPEPPETVSDKPINKPVKEPVTDPVADVEGLNREAWADYMEFRKRAKIKALAMPERTAKKLVRLANGSHKLQQAIVDQSIENNWQGLFELTGTGRGGVAQVAPIAPPKPRHNPLMDEFHRRMAAEKGGEK